MEGVHSFETSDLNLTSFLCSRGFQIGDIRKDDSRTVFSFAESAELKTAILDYANDGQVGARSFSNTLRDLKALSRDVAASDQQGSGV